MKRIINCIGLGLLCALAGGWSITEGGKISMRSMVFAADRPPIDRVIPAKLETATFALG